MNFIIVFLYTFLLFSCGKEEEEHEAVETCSLPVHYYHVSEQFAIHPSERFVLACVSFAEEARWNSGQNLFSSPILSDLYKHFKDSFDYILVIGNNEDIPAGLSYDGLYMAVRNTIQGIGLKNFDRSKSFGAKATLRGVMHLPYAGGVKYGPMLHEIMHTWANYKVIESHMWSSHSQSVSSASHWGLAGVGLDEKGGQLGGFGKNTLVQLEPNKWQITKSFGFWANGGNRIAYAPLELYLAGFIPASEVPDITYFTDITNYEYKEKEKETYFQAKKKLWTINDWIEKNGERKPNYQNSPKSFRAISILLSSKSLTEEQEKSIDENLSWFSFEGEKDDGLKNFWEGTGGRASFHSDKIKSHLLLPSS